MATPLYVGHRSSGRYFPETFERSIGLCINQVADHIMYIAMKEVECFCIGWSSRMKIVENCRLFFCTLEHFLYRLYFGSHYGKWHVLQINVDICLALCHYFDKKSHVVNKYTQTVMVVYKLSHPESLIFTIKAHFYQLFNSIIQYGILQEYTHACRPFPCLNSAFYVSLNSYITLCKIFRLSHLQNQLNKLHIIFIIIFGQSKRGSFLLYAVRVICMCSLYMWVTPAGPKTGS